MIIKYYKGEKSMERNEAKWEMERVIVTTFELEWWNAQYHSY